MDEPTYTFKHSSEPVVDFMNMKPNSNMAFHRDGTQIGALDFNGPEMTFTGDADESAKVFFDYIAKSFKARLEQERADERNSWPAEMEAMERQVNILTDALAEQPAPVQQEPVAWGIIASNTGRICQVELDADEVEGHNPKHIVPLCHCSQAQRKPLTDEQIHEMANDFEEGYVFLYRSFARAIEAAHGIKEQP